MKNFNEMKEKMKKDKMVKFNFMTSPKGEVIDNETKN